MYKYLLLDAYYNISEGLDCEFKTQNGDETDTPGVGIQCQP